MAGKNKPVDDAPLCDPAYVRRIDPVWMPGPVPKHFWEDRAHRRDYLLWFARRVGVRTMKDCYRIELATCFKKHRSSRLKAYWGTSAIDALRDCFPLYDWKPWLFRQVPGGFWDSLANRRSYMEWLGERLGYRRLDDWYNVTTNDFKRNGGSGPLKYYRSVTLAVIDTLPRRNWCEWKFSQVTPGFWEAAENRRRYMRWLGKEVGFRRPKDWYRIQTRDFRIRHGGTLLHRYSSLYDLMREFLPRLDWDRVDVHRPIGVEQVLAWADAHRDRHAQWPTDQSGKIPGTGHTWRAIDACLRGGCRGLPRGTSLARLLEKHRGVRLGRRPPPLSERQILVWADAYFAARRKWPTRESGPISGTRETWSGVHNAIRSGRRGLRRGSSLAQLLARRRGVRNRMRLPPFSERRVLAWARAHFQATGRWPSNESGPIAQSPENTWLAVDKALRKGSRGLPGGSSLAQLLRGHGLK